jgi:hypothetical protein
LEEIEAGPKGHWEGLSLFLYNPQSHQWSQSFLNSKNPVLSGGLVGEFHDGRGELYATRYLSRQVDLRTGSVVGDHSQFASLHGIVFE